MSASTIVDPNTGKCAAALGVVLDRDNAAATKLSSQIRALGGGWRAGLEAWHACGLRFALLIAPNPDRMRRRAPLLLAAKDPETLSTVLRTGCAMLDNITCAWLSAIAPDVGGLVDEELLRIPP
jgi:hypothetical protein